MQPTYASQTIGSLMPSMSRPRKHHDDTDPADRRLRTEELPSIAARAAVLNCERSARGYPQGIRGFIDL